MSAAATAGQDTPVNVGTRAVCTRHMDRGRDRDYHHQCCGEGDVLVNKQ